MKKLMKSSLLLMLIVSFLSCTKKTVATDTEVPINTARTTQSTAPTDDQRAQKMEDRKAKGAAMLAALNLSSEQETLMTNINEKYRAQMQELRQNRTGDREAMRAKMKAIRTAQTAEVKGILTSEQFATYEKMMAEQRKGRRGGGRRGGNMGG